MKDKIKSIYNFITDVIALFTFIMAFYFSILCFYVVTKTAITILIFTILILIANKIINKRR